MTAISALVTVFELSPSELFLQVVKEVDVRARCGRCTTITLTDSPGLKRFRSPGIGLVTSAAFKYYLLCGLKGSPFMGGVERHPHADGCHCPSKAQKWTSLQPRSEHLYEWITIVGPPTAPAITMRIRRSLTLSFVYTSHADQE